MAPPVTAVVCVMAKAPRPGAVKTRLCPPLSPEQAAALARAFLLDTWRVADALDGATALLSRAGDGADFPQLLDAVDAVAQRGVDLGARIESAMTAALARGRPALVIGSDLPGLPVGHLSAARAALEVSDCVLGPSADGGYYLIGARRWSPGLLADLPWSSPRTRAATTDRLRARGFTVAEAPAFDDVDEPADLERLREQIINRPDAAPATAAALADLTLG